MIFDAEHLCGDDSFDGTVGLVDGFYFRPGQVETFYEAIHRDVDVNVFA
jgi:hypothetical protein